MASETFSVVALPRSCAADADVHVSLFVAPALVADDPDGGQLRDFRLFPRWPDTLRADTRIRLFDQIDDIEAEPLLDPLDRAAWRAAFPPRTPVKGRGIPDWSDRKWRSFSARTVHDLGKALHLATMYSDPTTPPAPADHPLADDMRRITAEWFRIAADPGDDRQRRRRRVFDERIGTEDLDNLVESHESLAIIERAIAAEQDWMRRMLLELHRVRRFYERPESKGEYVERPIEGATLPAMKPPDPEFHERCAHVGDHRSLLRRFGLVIDLRVEHPDRLRQSTFLSATIAPRGDLAPCRTTRTRCRAVGDALVTVAETADWIDGLARIGDTDRYALLDLEADATALKTERFVWTLPRLLAIEEDDAPVNAASPALRSNGFTLVRTGQALDTQARLDRQRAIDEDLGQGNPPLLSTEDVTRGMRIEVWDSTAARWFSLHERLTDVEVLGHGKVYDDLEDEGFIQGTAATETADVDEPPVHVHEAVCGWEGWSLSAPRPGKRVKHVEGDEVFEDVDDPPDTKHPIRITNRVKPGTLPRLRFGRSYAMRAWAVDLAGNHRPHTLNPPAAPAGDIAASLPGLLPGGPGVLDAASRLPSELRAVTHAVLERRRLAAGETSDPPPLDLSERPELERILVSRLRARRADRIEAVPVARGSSRRSLVASAVATSVADGHQPFVADTATWDADVLTPAIATHVPNLGVEGIADSITAALATVTALRPFLRWDPVPSPALVPLERYTEGESLRVLVVRSGVTQDLDTLAITVTPPAAYAAAIASDHPGLDLRYAERSERHLAPPKTSQIQAELHGEFDDAIGSTDPDDHLRLLGIALLENGSFLDLDRADLANPPDRLDQPGVRLERNPGSPQADPVTLPLAKPGDPVPPGQYVVHDTPLLTLPYLPDPLARGISLVFEEAGLDRHILWPFGVEGFTARYGGTWPEIEPFRLSLDGADTLGGKVDGRVLTIALPPGDLQRFRLASSLTHDDLPLFGPWMSLPPAVRANHDVAEAAADGWLWGLTPFESVQLVHAVPRPLEAPRPTTLVPHRRLGWTQTIFLGGVDVHGPSTEQLTAEATWTDRVDDLTLPRWEDRPTAGIAFTSPVLPFEDIAVLGCPDLFAPGQPEGPKCEEVTRSVPGFGPVRIHAAIHQHGDTKHRVVSYRFRAATRFREYFHPDLLAAPAPDPAAAFGDPLDDGSSVVGPVVEVSIPSSARPAAPIVHSVLPLFRWTDGTEPEQPMGVRHARRAGVRIYLERPWYTSGTGELLGVLLAPGGDDTFGPPAPDQSGFPFVSKWGQDPVWISDPVDQRAMSLLQLDDLLHASGLDDRPEPGRPVTPPRVLPLASLPEAPNVVVLGYEPQFNQERGLWYVDVALDPGSTFWPFVRLAVCRYQPDSIEGCHLSQPVRCDHVQVPPERTTSVSRTDDRHVRVVVSGPIGTRKPIEGRGLDVETFADAVTANRQVVARLQRRDPLIDTDLGWETVASRRLTIRGWGQGVHEAAWVGELDAGEVVALQRPGDLPAWRVTVEEWEILAGDALSVAEAGPLPFVVPVAERRLVYADEVTL